MCWQFQLRQGTRESYDNDSVDTEVPIEIEDDVKCHSLSVGRHAHTDFSFYKHKYITSLTKHQVFPHQLMQTVT